MRRDRLDGDEAMGDGQPDRPDGVPAPHPNPVPPPAEHLVGPPYNYSVTIYEEGVDLPLAIVEPRVRAIWQVVDAGIITAEIGTFEHHLHLQGWCRIRMGNAQLVHAWLARGVGRVPGHRVQYHVTRMNGRGLHTPAGMTGYCLKQRHTPEFHVVGRVNISNEECLRGIQEYIRLGAGPVGARTMLTPNNLISKVATFLASTIPPQQYNLLYRKRTLGRMMRTGLYCPCTSWIVAGGGRGCDSQRYDDLYDMMEHPADTSMHQVRPTGYSCFC